MGLIDLAQHVLHCSRYGVEQSLHFQFYHVLVSTKTTDKTTSYVFCHLGPTIPDNRLNEVYVTDSHVSILL